MSREPLSCFHGHHLCSPRWVRRSSQINLGKSPIHCPGFGMVCLMYTQLFGVWNLILSDGPVQPPHTVNSQGEESRSSLTGPELSTPNTHSPETHEGPRLCEGDGGRASKEEAWKTRFWAPPAPESELLCFSPQHGMYTLRFWVTWLH